MNPEGVVKERGILFSAPMVRALLLGTKDTPLYSGVLNYFPNALAAIARVSKRGNDKHNPGESGWTP